MGLEFSKTVKSHSGMVVHLFSDIMKESEGIRFPLIRGVPKPLSIRHYYMSYWPKLGYIIILSCQENYEIQDLVESKSTTKRLDQPSHDSMLGAKDIVALKQTGQDAGKMGIHRDMIQHRPYLKKLINSHGVGTTLHLFILPHLSKNPHKALKPDIPNQRHTTYKGKPQRAYKFCIKNNTFNRCRG